MSDPINPPHYQGAIECIEVIEGLGIGKEYCRGCAIKYLYRLGRKGDPLEDAKKAAWYCNRLVKELSVDKPESPDEADKLRRVIELLVAARDLATGDVKGAIEEALWVAEEEAKRVLLSTGNGITTNQQKQLT